MNNIDHLYAVIMAGGGGTRLWPLSRQARPKQTVRLGGDRTLFQMAVDRLTPLLPADHIYVVTIVEQAPELKQECPEIPAENFLIEPLPRGTASVVGLAALALRQRDPHAVMAVLTSDHFIKNVDLFRELLVSGAELANQNYLVTLGIRPTFPATGYGYIQRGERLGMFAGNPAFQVVRFKEKPDEKLARSFLERGDHDWNSGMFIWRADRIWNEFLRLTPALASSLTQIAHAWGTPQQDAVLQATWAGITPQTIDYAIMEKASQVAVLPAANMGWNDVGSWEAMFEVFSADEDGNVNMQTHHLGLDTSDSLVCSENPQRLIVTIGVQNLVVVDTGDSILICSRDQAQKVRDVVNLLKLSGQQRYL